MANSKKTRRGREVYERLLTEGDPATPTRAMSSVRSGVTILAACTQSFHPNSFLASAAEGYSLRVKGADAGDSKSPGPNGP